MRSVSDDTARDSRILGKSVFLWCAFACFMLLFVVVAFTMPDELAKANVKTSPLLLGGVATHAVLLLVAALLSFKRRVAPMYVVLILLYLAMVYPIASKSLFGGVFVALLIVNAHANIYTIRKQNRACDPLKSDSDDRLKKEAPNAGLSAVSIPNRYVYITLALVFLGGLALILVGVIVGMQ